MNDTTPRRPARVKSKIRWLAVPITLGVFSMLTVGYLSSFTPAKIVDGSREVPVRTLQSTVDGALRDAGVELRPEDLAQFFGVGVATIIRWEKPLSTLPSGFPRQLYEIMDFLDRAGVDLSTLEWTLRMHGNVAAVRWLVLFVVQFRPY